MLLEWVIIWYINSCISDINSLFFYGLFIEIILVWFGCNFREWEDCLLCYIILLLGGGVEVCLYGLWLLCGYYGLLIWMLFGVFYVWDRCWGG